MCAENTQYEKICRGEFAALHAKLDRLDEAIRGNGKVGLATRIDRLEQVQAIRSRLLWLIAASALTGAVSLLTTVILQIVKVKP